MVKSARGSPSQSVSLKKGKLVIAAFTKGKSQLDPLDVEKARNIASVRIHVVRVTGLLRREYTILECALLTDSIVFSPHGPPHGQVPIMDGLVRVCSALVNVCPIVVPFD